MLHPDTCTEAGESLASCDESGDSLTGAHRTTLSGSRKRLASEVTTGPVEREFWDTIRDDYDYIMTTELLPHETPGTPVADAHNDEISGMLSLFPTPPLTDRSLPVNPFPVFRPSYQPTSQDTEVITMESEPAWDPSDIISTLTDMRDWSADELLTEYQRVYLWLIRLSIRGHSYDSGTAANRKALESELQNHSYTKEFFEEQVKRLQKKVGDSESLSLVLTKTQHLSHKWAELERLLAPAAANASQTHTTLLDVDLEESYLLEWLSETEHQLPNISMRSDRFFSLITLQNKLHTNGVLLHDIKSHGSAVVNLIKQFQNSSSFTEPVASSTTSPPTSLTSTTDLPTELLTPRDSLPSISPRSTLSPRDTTTDTSTPRGNSRRGGRVPRRIKQLEKRYHASFLKALEWQYYLEQLIADYEKQSLSSSSSASDCEDNRLVPSISRPHRPKTVSSSSESEQHSSDSSNKSVPVRRRRSASTNQRSKRRRLSQQAAERSEEHHHGYYIEDSEMNSKMSAGAEHTKMDQEDAYVCVARDLKSPLTPSAPSSISSRKSSPDIMTVEPVDASARPRDTKMMSCHQGSPNRAIYEFKHQDTDPDDSPQLKRRYKSHTYDSDPYEESDSESLQRLIDSAILPADWLRIDETDEEGREAGDHPIEQMDTDSQVDVCVVDGKVSAQVTGEEMHTLDPQCLQQLLHTAEVMVKPSPLPSPIVSPRDFGPLSPKQLSPLCFTSSSLSKKHRIKSWLASQSSNYLHTSVQDSCDASGELTSDVSTDSDCDVTLHQLNSAVSTPIVENGKLPRCVAKSTVMKRGQDYIEGKPLSVSVPSLNTLPVGTSDVTLKGSASDSVISHPSKGSDVESHSQLPTSSSSGAICSPFPPGCSPTILHTPTTPLSQGAPIRRRRYKLRRRSNISLNTRHTDSGGSDRPHLRYSEGSNHRIVKSSSFTGHPVWSDSNARATPPVAGDCSATARSADILLRASLPNRLYSRPVCQPMTVLSSSLSSECSPVSSPVKQLSAEPVVCVSDLWDNYQENKYLSEYSEDLDTEAAKKFLNFGDDYRKFLDSDGGSSLFSSPMRRCKFPRPTPSGSVSRLSDSTVSSRQSGPQSACSAVPNVRCNSQSTTPSTPTTNGDDTLNDSVQLQSGDSSSHSKKQFMLRQRSAGPYDSDSDVEDLMSVLQESQSHLTIAENILAKHTEAEALEFNINYSEVLLLCTSNISTLREVTQRAQATALTTQFNGLLQKWESLEKKAASRQAHATETQEFYSCAERVQKKLQSLQTHFNSEDWQSCDVHTLQQLQDRLTAAKMRESHLSELQAELSKLSVNMNEFSHSSGHQVNPQLKQQMSSLYQLAGELQSLVSGEVSSLDSSISSLEKWTQQSQELQQSLRKDDETLSKLQAAVLGGEASISSLSEQCSADDTLSATSRGLIRLLTTKQGSRHSDSGTSGYESCSSDDLSERERKLEGLKSLASELEKTLHPHSHVWGTIKKTISATENELLSLKKRCRELLVKTAEGVSTPSQSNRTSRRRAKGNSIRRSANRSSPLRHRSSSRTRSVPLTQSGWLWRVLKVSLPLQLGLLLLLCVLCFLRPSCCDHLNTFTTEFGPSIHHVEGDGPPV